MRTCPSRCRHARPRRRRGRSRSTRPSTRPPAQVRQARQAHHRHHGHLHVLELVLPALLRPAQRGAALLARGRGPLDAGGQLHRRHRARHPAPALQPLLHQGPARPRHDRHRRALREPALPGHGQGRQRRHHVQVQGQRRAAVLGDRALRRGHHAPGHPLHRPAREGLQLDEEAVAGRQPLHQARLARGLAAQPGRGRGGRGRGHARRCGQGAVAHAQRHGPQVHRRLRPRPSSTPPSPPSWRLPTRRPST